MLENLGTNILIGDMLIALAALALGFMTGWFFGRAATIGGPEHQDPTETEIKAAKEKYNNPYLSRYRTLVRITGVRGVRPNLTLLVVVPDWDSDEVFNLYESHLPDNIRSVMERRKFPIWLIAEANLSAETPGDLRLNNFELAPDPVSEEELQ